MKSGRWSATCAASAIFLLGVTAAANAQVTAPTVTMTASPDSITVGGKSTLTWSSTHATSCTASGGWSGSRATSGRRSVSPDASTTYTLSCTNSGETTSASATVTVTSAPEPTVTLAASPPSITAGTDSALTWSSANATSCTASGGWTGSKALSGTRSVKPAATTTYTLTCTGSGGTATTSTVVTVSTVPLPTATLTATPPAINAGASTTLAWSSTNATSCTANWTASPGLSGTQSESPSATTTYTLTCSGSGGQVTAMATVTVTQLVPPTVTLTATPATINAGAASTLAWSTTNATSCAATGGWTSSTSPSGTQSVAPAATTTYTLSCLGAGGTTPASVTVTVLPAGTPTVTLTANPTSVAAGGTSTLTWSSTNSTSCTASGSWSGTLATSGTQQVVVGATGTYSIACGTATASASASVTVSVSAAGAGGSFVQGEGWASANGGPVGPFKNSVNAADHLVLIAIQEGEVTSASVSDGSQTWTGVLYWYDSVNDETMYLMIPSNATQTGVHQATLTGSGKRVSTFKAWIIEDAAPLVVGSVVARSQKGPGAGYTINPGAPVGGAGNDLYYFVVDTTNGGSATAEPVLSPGWATPSLYNETLPDFDENVGALNLGRASGAGGTTPTMAPGSTGATTDTYTGLSWAVGSASSP
jgi:hypothetical protein